MGLYHPVVKEAIAEPGKSPKSCVTRSAGAAGFLRFSALKLD
jgi:hypothetical protein